jgi:hypothetical protein
MGTYEKDCLIVQNERAKLEEGQSGGGHIAISRACLNFLKREC